MQAFRTNGCFQATHCHAAGRAEHVTMPLVVWGWPQSRRAADRARLIVV